MHKWRGPLEKKAITGRGLEGTRGGLSRFVGYLLARLLRGMLHQLLHRPHLVIAEIFPLGSYFIVLFKTRLGCCFVDVSFLLYNVYIKAWPLHITSGKSFHTLRSPCVGSAIADSQSTRPSYVGVRVHLLRFAYCWRAFRSSLEGTGSLWVHSLTWLLCTRVPSKCSIRRSSLPTVTLGISIPIWLTKHLGNSILKGWESECPSLAWCCLGRNPFLFTQQTLLRFMTVLYVWKETDGILYS